MIPLTYLSDRCVLRLSGADIFDFLQGLITQDIFLLNTQQAIYTWMLNIKGRYLYDFFVIKDQNEFLIDTVKTPELLKHLKIYKLRRKVDIIESDLKVYVASQPSAEGIIVDDPRKDSWIKRIITPLSLEATTDKTAYTYTRICSGIPEFPDDLIQEKSFPLESRLKEMNGVSFKKGCYIGQELVSRTHYTGTIRKTFFPLRLEQPLPSKGMLTQGQRDVGEVFSHVSHQGDSVALAMIRIEECDLTAPFLCEGISCTVIS